MKTRILKFSLILLVVVAVFITMSCTDARELKNMQATLDYHSTKDAIPTQAPTSTPEPTSTPTPEPTATLTPKPTNTPTNIPVSRVKWIESRKETMETCIYHIDIMVDKLSNPDLYVTEKAWAQAVLNTIDDIEEYCVGFSTEEYPEEYKNINDIFKLYDVEMQKTVDEMRTGMTYVKEGDIESAMPHLEKSIEHLYEATAYLEIVQDFIE